MTLLEALPDRDSGHPVRAATPCLPAPRGALGAQLFPQLRHAPHDLPIMWASRNKALNEDETLVLYVCYEMHYRGFVDIDDEWEWEPSLLRLRAQLERQMIAQLLVRLGPPKPTRDVEAALVKILLDGKGLSLSRHMAEDGTIEQFREFAVHRSIYQLKEADPHTWAIPRLASDQKAALVAIQADEYGMGVAAQMHATLFARTLSMLGLDAAYGAYLNVVPAVTLQTVNLLSLFGLHRRWRGALVGHLAIFEMASVGPNQCYGDALRRLGFGGGATEFYDVHVVADAVHEELARAQLAGGLAAAEPELAGDIVFGAQAIMATERSFTEHLLDAWRHGRSSLSGELRLPANSRPSVF